ncbi:MAG TPA: GYD domain-containing protein [Thermoanaerobaculia bacterium]|jgi:uncharacterized protein with GYD domain|nr:GYD domain-containing protein [Thermoanaerobaculia bacterium]
MPHFLVRGSYTAEAWAKMIHSPEDREKLYAGLIEKAGGKLKAFYFAFGKDDVFAIFEAPDASAAASLAMAVGSVGHLSHFSTTSLMTTREAMDAMKKAGDLKYRGPKG